MKKGPGKISVFGKGACGKSEKTIGFPHFRPVGCGLKVRNSRNSRKSLGLVTARIHSYASPISIFFSEWRAFFPRLAAADPRRAAGAVLPASFFTTRYSTAAGPGSPAARLGEIRALK